MHIQQAQLGLLLYPAPPTSTPQPQWEGTLRGYGGSVGILGFRIPVKPDSFADFTFVDVIEEMDSRGKIIVRFLSDSIQPLCSFDDSIALFRT